MTAHAKAARLAPRQLASGSWTSCCPECETISAAATIEDLDAMPCACPPVTRQLVYLVELTCLSCGRRMGDVVATSPTAPLALCGSPRCKHCGGQPHPSGFVRTVDVTRYPPIAAPHRGRPRKNRTAA